MSHLETNPLVRGSPISPEIPTNPPMKLTGILLAGLVALKINLNDILGNHPHLGDGVLGVILYFGVIALLAWVMIRIPLKKIGEEIDA